MRRFFVEPENITGPNAVITGADARHISTVLRLAEGTTIILFDGSGSYYEAVLTRVSTSRAEAKIVAITPYIETAAENSPTLHLAIGVPKGKRMDLIIQKSTELGVASLHPFRSRYSSEQAATESRLSRWGKIAAEACKQCNRPRPPKIFPPAGFNDIVRGGGLDEHDLKLIFWEDEKGQKTLHRILEPLDIIRSVMVLIGPEGGFSTEEVERAVEAGFEPVTLGSRILRVETAAIAAASILQHELGNLE